MEFHYPLVFDTLARWLAPSASSHPYPLFIGSIVGICLLFGLTLGALTGWGIGRPRAFAGLLNKQPLWLRSVSGSKTIFWLHFTIGLIVVSNFKNLNAWAVLGLAFAWAIFIHWLVAFAVELSRPCFDAPITHGGAVFWSFITSLVLGLVPALALLSAFAPSLGRLLRDPHQIHTIFAFITISVTIPVFVASFTLALRDRKDFVLPNNTRRKVARSLFMLAALLIMPGFLVRFGFESSPHFAQQRKLPGDVVSAHFRFWPETDYFKLVSRPDAVFHVTAPPAASLRFEEGQTIEREYSDSLLKLPKGVGPLAVMNMREEHGAATATVVFREVLRLNISEKNPGDADDPILGKVQGVIASEADGRTSLTLSGKLPSQLPTEELIKVFLFDPETSRFLSESGIEKQSKVYVNRPRPWTQPGGVPWGEHFLPFRVLKEKDGEWLLKLYRQEKLDAATPGKQVEGKEHLAPAVSVAVGIAVVPIRADEMAQDAEFLAGQERFAEAVVLERRALELMGPNPDALYLDLHAWTLFRLGEFQESLHYARRAVALDSSSKYLDTLAHAAYSSGLWKEAVEAWDKVLAKDGRFSGDAYCKKDAELYATARAEAGLPPRPIPQVP